MNFLGRIDLLRTSYNCGDCKEQDNAMLYGIYISTPPLAKHIVFMPMTAAVMQKLTISYKRVFPPELLMLYRTMNGGDLFWTARVIGKRNIRIALPRLSIYGVPLTSDRKHIEPYNICIEDLNRPNGTPDSWLKFGSYYRPENLSCRRDLFIDTETKLIYAVLHGGNECIIMDTWDSLDSCLCYIFDLLSTQDNC